MHNNKRWWYKELEKYKITILLNLNKQIKQIKHNCLIINYWQRNDT